MTPRELIEWGRVRCHDPETGEVTHEGTVTAATRTQVQVRDDKGESRWFLALQCEPVGTHPAVYTGDDQVGG